MFFDFRTLSNVDVDVDDSSDDSSEGEAIEKPLKKRKSSNPVEKIGKKIVENSNERLLIMKKVADQQFEPRKEPSELDLFFQSICSTVRKFPPCEQARLKIDIQIMVGNYELSNLSNQTSQSNNDDSSHTKNMNSSQEIDDEHSYSNL